MSLFGRIVRAAPDRAAERWMVLHFLYIAILAWFFPLVSGARWGAFGVALAAAITLTALANASHQWGGAFRVLRDWVPLAFTLVAYREMDWFTPFRHEHHLENTWIVWDRVLMGEWGLRNAIESLGSVLPSYLELCYLVVYAVGPFAVAMLYLTGRRHAVPLVLYGYISATLGAYALFPFFPSEPPRVVFAGADLPAIDTMLRRFNLWIVGGYGIHSSVFPSAHVSSAFGAAFGMMLGLGNKRRGLWIGLLIYAASVAVATVYGRYHYAIDAVAGLGIALLTLGWARLRRKN